MYTFKICILKYVYFKNMYIKYVYIFYMYIKSNKSIKNYQEIKLILKKSVNLKM